MNREEHQQMIQFVTAVMDDVPVAHARKNDRETSKEAAASVTNIRQSQETILYLLKTHGPMCDQQLFEYVRAGMSPSGARSRRAECVANGWVKDSGRRQLTAANRRTIVWEVVRRS